MADDGTIDPTKSGKRKLERKFGPHHSREPVSLASLVVPSKVSKKHQRGQKSWISLDAFAEARSSDGASSSRPTSPIGQSSSDSESGAILSALSTSNLQSTTDVAGTPNNSTGRSTVDLVDLDKHRTPTQERFHDPHKPVFGGPTRSFTLKSSEGRSSETDNTIDSFQLLREEAPPALGPASILRRQENPALCTEEELARWEEQRIVQTQRDRDQHSRELEQTRVPVPSHATALEKTTQTHPPPSAAHSDSAELSDFDSLYDASPVRKYNSRFQEKFQPHIDTLVPQEPSQNQREPFPRYQDYDSISQNSNFQARDSATYNMSYESTSSSGPQAETITATSLSSLEWDPDMASGPLPSEEQSPEAVLITPKPLAYTTVGSVVNPNQVPQFSAPNRIQREGSGRRSQPIMHSRQYDYVRGIPPSLNMQSSMQYTPSTNSPIDTACHHHTPGSSSRSSRSGRLSQSTDVERQTLARLQGPTPRMMAGNVAEGPSFGNSYNTLFSNTVQYPAQKNARDLWNESPPQSQPRFVGMEKMQTVRSLAKFDNPMQHLAKSRLEGLTAEKLRTFPTPDNPAAALDTLLLNKQMDAVRLSLRQSLAGSGAEQSQWQVPLSFNSNGQSQLEPGHPDYEGWKEWCDTIKVESQSRPRYPAPLTAGPPGRQKFTNRPSTLPTASRPSSSFTSESFPLYRGYSGSISTGSQNVTPQFPENVPYHNSALPYGPGNSPWDPNFTRRSSSPPLMANSIMPSTTNMYEMNLQERAPVPRVSKFFQGALPTDLTDSWAPLPLDRQEMLDKMIGFETGPVGDRNERNGLPRDQGRWVEDPSKGPPDNPTYGFGPRTSYGRAPAVDIDEREIKPKGDLSWASSVFHSGSNKWSMTSQEVEMNAEDRLAFVRKYGPIAPEPAEQLPVTMPLEPVSVEEVLSMPTSKVAGSLLDLVYSSIRSYNDRELPESRLHLSRFQAPPEYQIDRSARGNDSLFSEDYDRTPKQADGFQFDQSPRRIDSMFEEDLERTPRPTDASRFPVLFRRTTSSEYW